MRIAVIGAGIAGLAATKVLTAVGHEVTTFDTEPEAGGVWSPTRHYPGLTTQNTRMTYEYSDHPAPDDWPDYPSAEQWHGYLRGYVERFQFGGSLRLGTGVVSAEPIIGADTVGGADGTGAVRGAADAGAARGAADAADADAAHGTAVTVGAAGWDVRLDSGEHVQADHLVVANGVFYRPLIPDWPGHAEHAEAGGVVKAPSQGLTLHHGHGRHVVVVGYGKSACDTAMAMSRVAASVTMVPRRLLWKGPKVLLGKHFEDVAITRLGEVLFANPQRFGPLFNVLSRATVKQQGLAALGLIPPGRFEDIAASSASLATDGFFDAVRSGTIAVRRDRTIAELRGGNGPQMVLDDGSVLPAELIVAATGFEQSVPFLDPALPVRNADSDFELFRNVLPHHIPNLTFAGYNTSLVSSLSAEVGAIWIAAHLAGALNLPPLPQRQAQARADLLARKTRTHGKYASGTLVLPRSIGNIDAMMRDMHAVLPRRTRLAQWTRRSYSTDFRETLAHAVRRLSSAG